MLERISARQVYRGLVNCGYHGHGGASPPAGWHEIDTVILSAAGHISYRFHPHQAQKLKYDCSSSLWTCLHHMVMVKSQNKITDFFMILNTHDWSVSHCLIMDRHQAEVSDKY